MPKGYTTKAELAKFLGRTFDANQDDIADLCIGAAEIVIDRKTSVKFLESTPQTKTIYQPPSPLVQLFTNGPISAVSAVGYTLFGGTSFPMIAGTHYEVRDLERGILWVPYPSDYYKIDITYTPTATAPDNIKLVANILAAHWMRPILNDEVPGLANYSIGGEFSISFAQYVQERGYPAEVDTLLGVPSLYIG